MSDTKPNDEAEFRYQCRIAETPEVRAKRRKRRQEHRKSMREYRAKRRKEAESRKRKLTSLKVIPPFVGYLLIWIPIMLVISVLISPIVFTISIFTNGMRLGDAVEEAMEFFGDLFLADWVNELMS